MLATIINGKLVAKDFRARLKERIDSLNARGIVPGLTAVLVGDDPASAAYVGMKEKAAAKLGIRSQILRHPADITQEKLDGFIDDLNADPAVHGYIVQLPLPKHLDVDRTIHRIRPTKDADCFHPENVGLMTIGRPRFLPATPAGIIELLRYYEIPTSGADVVVLGRSNIVGRPLSIMLSQKADVGDATVTICHTRTKDWTLYTKRADILIAAVGRPNTVTADMVKPGVTVIDVGSNRIEDPSAKRGYRFVGDVDYDALVDVAGAITPVPGGVGPMTVTMLMANTVTAAEQAAK